MVGPGRIVRRTLAATVLAGPPTAWLCNATLASDYERHALLTAPFLLAFLVVTVPFSIVSGLMGGAAALGAARWRVLVSSRAAWVLTAAVVGSFVGVSLVSVTILVLVGAVDPRRLDRIVWTYALTAAMAGAVTGAIAAMITWPVVARDDLPDRT